MNKVLIFAAAVAMLWPIERRTVAEEGIVEETFDDRPTWDGYRNRLLPDDVPTVRHDFGYRTTNRAGGKMPGEAGGVLQRAHRRAYYAKRIAPVTLQDSLSATGKFAVTKAGGSSGVLIGWFNHQSSLGWRTPNSLAMRIDGNGGKYWIFYEYGTSAGRTGGGGAFEGERYQTTPTPPQLADGSVHSWSLEYDPQGAGEPGLVTFDVDEERYQLPLHPGHKTDGAIFDRFGIWNQQTSGDALEFFLDDLEINGTTESFDSDPNWAREGNPATYRPRIVRPFHEFGFSRTAWAGQQLGEIGGVVFRDEQPMYYGDEVGPFSLDCRLRASGKIILRSAGADSAVKLGWFGASAKKHKVVPEHEEPQTDYCGVMIEGPSRVGHFFRAAYSTARGTHAAPTHEATPNQRPIIRPGTVVHDWSMTYDPQAANKRGRITVTLDDTTHQLDLKNGAKAEGATLDRFGVFNTQSGGHHVEVYLDNLTYSKTHAEEGPR